MRIGFIGLGDIGMPIARRILQSGHDLTVWGRSAAKLRPISSLGAPVAAGAADLAQRSDLVFLCIDTVAGIEEILFGSAGIMGATQVPRLVIDHSTVHPQAAMDFAARLADRGIAFVDAPVSGGAAGARAGTLAVMMGGNPANIAVATPVIASYAARMTHLGKVGAGQAGKACNQIINFGALASIAEALCLARVCGLDVAALPLALEGGLADSNMLREYVRGRDSGDKPHMTALIDCLAKLLAGQADPCARDGRFDLPLKDMGIVASLAAAGSLAAPVSLAVETLCRMAAGARIATPPRDAVIS